MKAVYCKVGERHSIIVAHSECAMSMCVAGKLFEFEMVSDRCCQLYHNGLKFSSPILNGEAGIFDNNGNHYYYSPELNLKSLRDFYAQCLMIVSMDSYRTILRNYGKLCEVVRAPEKWTPEEKWSSIEKLNRETVFYFRGDFASSNLRIHQFMEDLTRFIEKYAPIKLPV